ncbi:hypothetical protein BYT27DRAFT_7156889 [Phlegmacium glaucopus]|nr:hypothetical protein BYT27DRAFT_7156889 [Phlegmacium glaucopus]
MRPLSNSIFSIWVVVCATWVWHITYASAYFIVQEPQSNRQWVNNGQNLVTWTKGLKDGINGFDIEMARMSHDGLTLVAKNVLAAQGKLNLMLLDVPPGDDYFLLFINSTHGVMYATSNKFTILAPSATPSVTPPSPATSVPTVTVSGSPNPTQQFATTFPALPNGAIALFTTMQARGLVLTLLGCSLGAFLTLGW